VALCNLTGLNMAEVQLSLAKGDLVAGDGLSKTRARDLALSISRDPSLRCRIERSERPGDEPVRFRVVLTGYRPGSRANLRKVIQKMSGLPYEQVVVWFSRIPFVLLDGAGHSDAMAVRRTVTEAGGIVDVQPEGMRPSRPDRGGPGDEAPETVEAAGAAVPKVAVGDEPAPGEGEVATPLPPDQKDDSIPEREFEKAPIPPVIGEYGYIDDIGGIAIPPAVRFTQPGRGPDIPPVAGRPAASEEDPLQFEFDEPPRYRAVPPPLPHNSLKLFLCRPPDDDRDRIALALERVCDFDRRKAADTVVEFPAWVASFSDPRRASELAVDLERQGATPTLAWSMPGRPSEDRKKSSKPLLSWLSVE